MNSEQITLEIKALQDQINEINAKLCKIDHDNKEELEEAIAELADIVV